MNKLISYTVIALFSCSLYVSAQNSIFKADFIKIKQDTLHANLILNGLNKLIHGIENGYVDESLLDSDHLDLTKSTLNKLINLEKELISDIEKQLMNIYPIADNEYLLTIGCLFSHQSTIVNKLIIDLTAKVTEGKVLFSIPLKYYTRYWKTKKVGNVNYYFRDTIETENGEFFKSKNEKIAGIFGLEAEKFDFYLTDNYQEILMLRGFRYSASSNGEYRDGYGVVGNTIFAVAGNEDFSHDLVHYYSKKVNKQTDRNWLAEEAAAYYWGNAYYNDQDGKTITIHQLIKELQLYLREHPDTDILDLLLKNDRVINSLAPEISVRTVITAVILKEIEKRGSSSEVKRLIRSGSNNQLDNFLKITDELIGLNKQNFHTEMMNYLNLRESTF